MKSRVMNSKITFIHSVSLLVLRSVERWLIEVTKRLSMEACKVSLITFQTDLEKYPMMNLMDRLTQIKSQLRNVNWKEVKALYHTHASQHTIAKLLKKFGIVIPLSIFQIFKIIRGSRSIYIAVGDAYQALVLTLIVMLFGGRKIVLGLHASRSYRRFKRLSMLFRLLSRMGIIKGIHCISYFDYISLNHILKGVPIFHIPNGVDCEKFSPDKGVKRYDIFNVLFVGALSEDKGIDIFLKIAEILKTKHPSLNIRFVIVSVGGPWANKVREMASKGYVDYLGFVNDSKLAKLYAEAHIAVFPSRVEAFSFVALEAQASGTPVICSNAPGFKNSVIDGITGIVVKDYNPHSFIEAILKLYKIWMEGGNRYQEIVKHARERAKFFCWDKILKSLRHILLN